MLLGRHDYDYCIDTTSAEESASRLHPVAASTVGYDRHIDALDSSYDLC
jgi:hypothetical protein